MGGEGSLLNFSPPFPTLPSLFPACLPRGFFAGGSEKLKEQVVLSDHSLTAPSDFSLLEQKGKVVEQPLPLIFRSWSKKERLWSNLSLNRSLKNKERISGAGFRSIFKGGGTPSQPCIGRMYLDFTGIHH